MSRFLGKFSFHKGIVLEELAGQFHETLIGRRAIRFNINKPDGRHLYLLVDFIYHSGASFRIMKIQKSRFLSGASNCY
jgi:hypothetical protein